MKKTIVKWIKRISIGIGLIFVFLLVLGAIVGPQDDYTTQDEPQAEQVATVEEDEVKREETASSSSEELSVDKEPELQIEKPDDLYTYVAASNMVSIFLKNPDSAEFPSSGKIIVDKMGEIYDLYISSYVTAENSFGGKMRHSWEVVMWYVGGDPLEYESYLIRYITIDGEIIYEQGVSLEEATATAKERQI